MIPRALLERICRAARAERWSLPASALEPALEAALHATSGATADPRELERALLGLHLEDLALACACAAGSERAWDHFMTEYRPVLYRAAAAVDRSGGARDLADSLYAELWGVRSEGDERRSLFRYFHGRSSLSTWLRAVLSQRHVDRLRGERRLQELPTAEALRIAEPASDPERVRLSGLVAAALGRVVQALPPRERFRLRAYYEQGMTLADIGRLTKEHEATVSRQLARTRRGLRSAVEAALQADAGLGPDELAEAWRAAADDPGPLDLRKVFDD